MAEIRTAPSLLASLAAAFLLLAPSAPLAQTSATPAEASRHFERGYLLAQQGSLEEAISEFNQAYALQPHPSVLYNLGQAYAASGRAVEAVETLARFLEQAPADDAERRAQATSLMEYQSQRIGLLSVAVFPDGTSVSVDGVALGQAPLAEAIELVAGNHALVLTRAGYQTRAESFKITGKARLSLSLVMEPIRPASTSTRSDGARAERALTSLREEQQRRRTVQRTSAIIGGGVALASLAAAGALYLSNQQGYEDWTRESQAFAQRLKTTAVPTSRELDGLLAQENSLRNRDAWALGLAVFGAVAGTTSLALWLTAPRADQGRLNIQLGSNPWLGYSGCF